jgi:RNA polymerase sigma-70 factor (ECF subfamily)
MIAAGNQNGFRTLIRRFNQLLYRTARSIVKDDFDAEDVVQNAYFLVHRDIGKFRGESKLSTWLVRIVINEALACLRKRARSAHVINLDAQELDQMLESAAEPTSNRAALPEEILSRCDLRRLIDATIDKLPASYRTVFVLRAVHELSVAETAARLGVPEATVRTRFFRARTQLCAALSLALSAVDLRAVLMLGTRGLTASSKAIRNATLTGLTERGSQCRAPLTNITGVRGANVPALSPDCSCSRHASGAPRRTTKPTMTIAPQRGTQRCLSRWIETKMAL